MTGAEMLYADIGHFGKSPIRRTWYAFVFPALFLSYMGQGAFLLHQDKVPDNLFYRLAPEAIMGPMVILATAATVIASQAVISGTFSLARQAVQLGFSPRMRIVHTAADTIGQVYVPFVNFALFACTVAVILLFKTSGNLAAAYGIAVSAVMVITTMLMLVIAPALWPSVPRAVLWGGGMLFLLLDLVLFTANLSKLTSGGWIVAVLALGLVTLMSTWVAGRRLLRRIAERQSFPAGGFRPGRGTRAAGARTRHRRVPFRSTVAAPRALLHNYRHNKILHVRTLVVAALTEDTPQVPARERATVTPLGQGVTRVTLRFGFMETPNVPHALAGLDLPDGAFDPTAPAIFWARSRWCSRVTACCRAGGAGSSPCWRATPRAPRRSSGCRRTVWSNSACRSSSEARGARLRTEERKDGRIRARVAGAGARRRWGPARGCRTDGRRCAA